MNLRLIRHYQQRHSRLHHQFPAIILMDTRWQPRWQPTGISQFNKLWKQSRLPVGPDSGFLDGGTTLLLKIPHRSRLPVVPDSGFLDGGTTLLLKIPQRSRLPVVPDSGFLDGGTALLLKILQIAVICRLEIIYFSLMCLQVILALFCSVIVQNIS